MTKSQLKGNSDCRVPHRRNTLTTTEVAALPASRLGLTVGIDYEIVRTDKTGSSKFKVATRGYKHQVVMHDEDMTEVVLFHWHPGKGEHGKPLTVHPHIHIGPQLLDKDSSITSRAHIPSGRVAMEDVIEFLIRDCGVTPLRDDWESVLSESRNNFRQYASWGTGSPSAPSVVM